MPQAAVILPIVAEATASLPIVAKATASFLVSQASKIMTARSQRKNQDNKAYGFQINSQSTNQPIPVVYGKSRVPINRVYINYSGTDNEYIHIIGILAEGEIEGFDDQVEGVDPLFFDNKLYTEFGAGNVYYELFTGTATQSVCATLNAACPEWTDPLRYTAYIYLRLKFDAEKFQALPEVTVGIKGLEVLDPNTSVTAYSNNPALCAHDFLTRSPLRGGFGLDTSKLLTSSTESSRSYCVTKGWTCNLPITENDYVTDNLQLILNNFRGEIIKSIDKYELRFKDLNYESVVMNLTEDHVISDSLKISDPAINQTPVVIIINYLSSEADGQNGSTYKVTPFTFNPTNVQPNESYVDITINCLGLSDINLVQKMAYYFYERYSNNKSVTFSAIQEACQLDAMDLITLTHTVPGWTQQYLRVLKSTVNSANNTVSLVCVEESLSFYNDVYETVSQIGYSTTLPDPTAEPYPVINVNHSEEFYPERGRSRTRWVINFDPPAASDDPFFDYAEIWLKIGTGDYIYMTRSGGNYVVDPVEEGETYYLKIVAVNIYGRKQSAANATIVSKNIVGKSSGPSSLSSMTAAANGDGVSIYSNKVTDSDIDGYEVRLGDAWSGAIFISYNKNCSLRLNGVRPGTHTFWMSPRDNAGNYSASPVSATCKVFRPPGYTQLPTYGAWSWDFTTGTFDNTEHDTYDSNDVLKCSHTGGVLTGTWTSPTMDLNAVEDVRIWGDFLTNFLSSSTTWAGVAPSGTTWNDLGAGKTWAELFSATTAGIVRATLKISTDNTEWSEIDFFEIQCAEVTARYIKVVITLTDPAQDANIYLKELNMVAYEGPQ